MTPNLAATMPFTQFGKKSEENSYTYTLRQSFVIPIFKILFMEFLFIFLHLIFQKAILLFGLHESFMKNSFFEIFELASFHLVNITVLAFIVLHWYSTSYAINPQEVSITTGLLHRQKSSGYIRDTQEMEISQGIFGRLFGYGTIQIRSPLWKSDLFLKNIPSLQKYAEIIESYRSRAVIETPTPNIIPKYN